MRNSIIAVAVLSIFSATAQSDEHTLFEVTDKAPSDTVEVVDVPQAKIVFQQPNDGLPSRVLKLTEITPFGEKTPKAIVGRKSNDLTGEIVLTENIYQIDCLPILEDGSENLFIQFGNGKTIEVFKAPYQFLAEGEVVIFIVKNSLNERHGH